MEIKRKISKRHLKMLQRRPTVYPTRDYLERKRKRKINSRLVILCNINLLAFNERLSCIVKQINSVFYKRKMEQKRRRTERMERIKVKNKFKLVLEEFKTNNYRKETIQVLLWACDWYAEPGETEELTDAKEALRSLEEEEYPDPNLIMCANQYYSEDSNKDGFLSHVFESVEHTDDTTSYRMETHRYFHPLPIISEDEKMVDPVETFDSNQNEIYDFMSSLVPIDRKDLLHSLKNVISDIKSPDLDGFDHITSLDCGDWNNGYQSTNSMKYW